MELPPVETAGKSQPTPEYYFIYDDLPPPPAEGSNRQVRSSGSGPSPNKSPVPSDKNDKPTCNNPKSSNPVILSTGEKYEEATDFTAAGMYGLSMSRTYHSKATTPSMFGSKWYGTYNYPKLVFAGCDHLTGYPGVCFPHTMTYTDNTGSSWTYTKNSTSGEILIYKARGASWAGTMTYDPDSGEIILLKGRDVLRYDGGGKVQTAKVGGGPLLSFTYLGPFGALSSVKNAINQTLTFNYTGSRVTSIVDTGGNTWTYGYTASGMLASVTAPGGMGTRTYHYEHQTDSSLLTGISINGTRFSTYSYDANKRVATSVHTGGELSDTLSYGTNQTTVTDARGQATTYSFALVAGALQLTGISRAASSTCPAAAATTAYDANGWVDYTLDWNGNKTEHSYDIAGRLQQVVSGSGTADALTTINVWSGDNITETQYKDTAGTTYLKILYTYFTSGPANGTPSSITYVDVATGVQRVTSFGYTATPTGIFTTRTMTQTLPGGNAVTTYAYDSLGNVSSVTNALGHVTTYASYNGLGLPGRVTDPNGVITDYVYNANGTRASQTAYVNGGSRVTTYAYDHARNLTDTAFATGRVDRVRYKNFERVEYVGNALNEFTQVAYHVPWMRQFVCIRAQALRGTLASGSTVHRLLGSIPAVSRQDWLRSRARPQQSRRTPNRPSSASQ